MRGAKTLRETLSRRPTLWAIALGCSLWMVASVTPSGALLDRDQIGDTPGYERVGEAILTGEVPYRDFSVEYPPAALVVFVIPAIGSGTDYAQRFKLLMALLGLALVVVTVTTLTAARADSPRLFAAAALVGITPAALGPVVVVNYDVWPAVLAAGAIAATTERRSATAGALLACGFAAKVFPVLLLPMALVHLHARAGRPAALRCLAAFAAVVAAILAPFAIVATGGVGNDVLNALRRPLQIESLGSSLLLAAHRLGVYTASVNSDFNSQNLDGTLAKAVAAGTSLVAAAVVLAVVFLHRRRAGEVRALLVAAAAAVTGAVAFGKVLSPQYMVWLVPLVAVTGSRAAIAATAAALLLTHAWFPSRYGDLVVLGSVAWLVLARNLVLVALAAGLVHSLRRRGGPG